MNHIGFAWALSRITWERRKELPAQSRRARIKRRHLNNFDGFLRWLVVAVPCWLVVGCSWPGRAGPGAQPAVNKTSGMFWVMTGRDKTGHKRPLYLYVY